MHAGKHDAAVCVCVCVCLCLCVCVRARRPGRQARQYRRPACAAPVSVWARRAGMCAQHTGACAQHAAVGARRQGGGIVEFANKSDQEYALSKLDDTEFTARNGDKVRREESLQWQLRMERPCARACVRTCTPTHMHSHNAGLREGQEAQGPADGRGEARRFQGPEPLA